MSKEQAAAPAETTGATPKKDKKVAKSAATAREEKKQAWTIERCKKAAARFETLNEWKEGAPSSFKSATARGWVKDCEAHMKSLATARKTPTQKPLKKSA
jgi:hypothetical protein